MSERDSVHKEIEKLQEEIKEKNKKLASHEGRNKHYDDEVNKEKTQLSTSLLDNAPNKIIVGCIIPKVKGLLVVGRFFNYFHFFRQNIETEMVLQN